MARTQAIMLNEADHARVSAAVSAAEARSAGEIVTIVTPRSDSYSDMALAWAALVAFTALAVLALIPEFYMGLVDSALGRWQSEWTPRHVLELALGIAAIKFAAMLLLQRWQPLKYWLIPAMVKSARVRERAVTCFKVGAERRTHGRTGILIYLSLSEHRAEIVADEAIAGQVSAEVWGEAMAAMLAEIRAGRIADGLIAAVDKVGAVLAQHFPRSGDDTNELPDRLIEV